MVGVCKFLDGFTITCNFIIGSQRLCAPREYQVSNSFDFPSWELCDPPLLDAFIRPIDPDSSHHTSDYILFWRRRHVE